MEKRKNMYEMSGAGDIAKELDEIKKCRKIRHMYFQY